MPGWQQGSTNIGVGGNWVLHFLGVSSRLQSGALKTPVCMRKIWVLLEMQFAGLILQGRWG